jgi:pimeloyl-ACP methyl ester carboxylesterase
MAVSRRIAFLTVSISVVGLLSVVPAAVSANAAPAAPGSSAQVTARSTVHWGRCSSMELQADDAQCAHLRVPLDYGKPAGAKVTLALARVKHTSSAAKYQGVMLTNPGGPGGAGRYLAGLTYSVPNGVGSDYDWIGFDPRGTGASRPAISCDKNYFSLDRPNYNPARTADLKAWLKRSKAYARACGRKNGPILEHMTTVDSARDMNRIRIALGAKQINYYGFSYGTYLGQVYATMFPSHVRRFVLDSNVDPRNVWYRANLAQDLAFQKNTTVWFGWLAKYDSVYHLGSTEKAVADRWYKIRTRLTNHPDHGIGPDEWTDVFLDAEYYQSTWLDQAQLFSYYVNDHDYGAVKRAYRSSAETGNDNEYAGYNAVQCTDVAWPKSWTKWVRDNAKVNRRAPFETWANAWYNAPCLYWPAAAHKPVKVDGRKVGRVLLIDETGDAATPYEGSLEVRRLFPKSRLIALPGGTSHANSLSGDPCLDSKVMAYLRTGRLPARRSGNRADATCRPLPRPRP